MIQTLGLISIVFVVAFTWFQATRGNGSADGTPVSRGGWQSPAASMWEAWTNIGIGFSVNYVANLLLLPLVGLVLTHSQNFWLGCVYTAISVVRQFVIRRCFNGAPR
jgi:hypothetical protein